MFSHTGCSNKHNRLLDKGKKPIILNSAQKMNECKLSYVVFCFKQILYLRPTEKNDENMAPPTKKSKISLWRAIDFH